MNNEQIHEVRFTAKRACIWDRGINRWKTISRENAHELIALGQAVEVKKWI